MTPSALQRRQPEPLLPPASARLLQRAEPRHWRGLCSASVAAVRAPRHPLVTSVVGEEAVPVKAVLRHMRRRRPVPAYWMLLPSRRV
jgi:hypothetical protein